MFWAEGYFKFISYLSCILVNIKTIYSFYKIKISINQFLIKLIRLY